MPPSITNVPPDSLPVNLKPSAVTPCVFRQSISAPHGRLNSFSVPVNAASAPSAAATGIKNLKVEPLSPQSASAFLTGEKPFVTKSPPERQQSAPSAVSARTVARTSLESPVFLTVFLPPERQAAIISLCAKDLDGGAATVPEMRDG